MNQNVKNTENFIDKVVWPKSAKYIVAVSGGVDSITLLYLLKYISPNKASLVVAHADHGWRSESKMDADFVRKMAQVYDLPFELGKLTLKTKSESDARYARYEFLELVRQKHRADAIITAHHLDDCIETAVFNLLRGTNIYGLSSLRSTELMVRPLIKVTKQQIIEYAQMNDLKWREDSSNSDMHYTRNRIRHELLPGLRGKNSNFDHEFGKMISRSQELNDEIISLVTKLISQHGIIAKGKIELPTYLIRQLQLPVLRHVLILAIRILQPGAQLDASTIEQASLHLKTGRINRLRKLNNQLNLAVQGDKVIITCK